MKSELYLSWAKRLLSPMPRFHNRCHVAVQNIWVCFVRVAVLHGNAFFINAPLSLSCVWSKKLSRVENTRQLHVWLHGFLHGFHSASSLCNATRAWRPRVYQARVCLSGLPPEGKFIISCFSHTKWQQTDDSERDRMLLHFLLKKCDVWLWSIRGRKLRVQCSYTTTKRYFWYIKRNNIFFYKSTWPIAAQVQSHYMLVYLATNVFIIIIFIWQFLMRNYLIYMYTTQKVMYNSRLWNYLWSSHKLKLWTSFDSIHCLNRGLRPSSLSFYIFCSSN